MGRATQGVRLINLRENDSIASVAYVEVDDEEIEIPEVIAPESEPDTNGEEIGKEFED
jgi:DNA gyrase subunit A